MNDIFVLSASRTAIGSLNGTLANSILRDGLMDPYDNVHMGDCGELCAKEHGITREMQDEWAVRSYTRALEAQAKGYFKNEIVAVDGVELDEEPGRAKLDKVS